MLRFVAVTAPLFLLLLAGCAGMKTDTKAADLKAELDAAQASATALKDRLAIAEEEKTKLAAGLKAAQSQATNAQAAADKSTSDLKNLKDQYDKLGGSLADQLKDVPGVVLDKKGSVLVSGLKFELGGTQLNDESLKAVQKLAGALAAQKGLVVVDGHTDNVPVEREETKKLYVDNLGLSLARAAAVARVLVEAKVPAERIIVRGFGSTQPIDTNDTPEGREKNRRVDIRLIPQQPDTK